MKALLFAIHPEPARAILTRRKLREVRKTTAKNIKFPCPALIYETKGTYTDENGNTKKGAGAVVGHFTCNGYTRSNMPEYFGCIASVAALTKAQLMAYAGGKSLTFYDVQDVRQYQTPKPLEAYGVTAAPQSWQYIDVQPELLEQEDAQ